MLFTLAIVLFILWALGAFAFHVGGGLIHLLLVLALIVIVYRLITGRRPVVLRTGDIYVRAGRTSQVRPASHVGACVRCARHAHSAHGIRAPGPRRLAHALGP